MRSSSLVLWALFFSSGAVVEAKPKPKAQRPMPTASLPIDEPYTADEEILRDDGGAEAKDATAARSLVETAPARSPSSGRDLAAGIRVQMTREGFGGQLRILEFSRNWLAVSQTLRYFAPEKSLGLYDSRYGLLLGLEAHPWRKARLSPFLTLQGGAEHFVRRSEDGGGLDLPVGEAAVGLELQLNRFASFSLQWVNSYYKGLRSRLFEEQVKRGPSHASLEVFFTMDWEAKL